MFAAPIPPQPIRPITSLSLADLEIRLDENSSATLNMGAAKPAAAAPPVLTKN